MLFQRGLNGSETERLKPDDLDDIIYLHNINNYPTALLILNKVFIHFTDIKLFFFTIS
ncbi:hypothetical protein XSR1_280039 [Xenorhabdus szentirmaii DSM 16338]|uniref:Uncharacterized protein n=1 Tax=Xenorhabdus szentirmaii DSM 16338 TaxID=1427518 RepID=W1IX33_9GAMM|nr:hypothetical protein XSR1_280039 [Xenorhabdus szentirmaii DSM 16338]